MSNEQKLDLPTEGPGNVEYVEPDAPEPPPEEETPKIPFEVRLLFEGNREEVYEFTEFEPVALHGKIVDAKWKQDHATPGDELLQYVDWAKVIRVSVASIETTPRRRGRR